MKTLTLVKEKYLKNIDQFEFLLPIYSRIKIDDAVEHIKKNVSPRIVSSEPYQNGSDGSVGINESAGNNGSEGSSFEACYEV